MPMPSVQAAGPMGPRAPMPSPGAAIQGPARKRKPMLPRGTAMMPGGIPPAGGRGFAEGGTVRGAGCAQRGVKKCKVR